MKKKYFEVHKRFKGDWIFIDEFASFEDAHAFFEDKICRDYYNEGDSDGVFWISDDMNPKTAFKGFIKMIKA